MMCTNIMKIRFILLMFSGLFEDPKPKKARMKLYKWSEKNMVNLLQVIDGMQSNQSLKASEKQNKTDGQNI